MLDIVVATQNKHKMSEIEHILTEYPIRLKRLNTYTQESVPETGQSFIENALIKARFASQITGLPALADDSGLMLPCLHGAPGIYSARYAGPTATDQDNIQKLLTLLSTEPSSPHTAYFICTLACIRHAADPLPLIVQGICKGLITPNAKGMHGFGYDPIFWLPDHQCSMAELAPDIKNQISHRGIALNQLKKELPDWILI